MLLATHHPLLDSLSRLEALIGALEAGEPLSAQVEAALERLQSLCSWSAEEDLSEVRNLVEALLEAPSSDLLLPLREAVEGLGSFGPTPSHAANRVLGLSLAAVHGRRVEEYSSVITALDAEIEALAQGFAGLARAGVSSRMAEEAERVLRDVEALRESLVALDEAVGTGSEEAAREAGDGLVGALRTLASCLGSLEVLAQQEGRTPCLRCGQLNPPGRSRCEQCGAILPKAAAGQESVLDVRVGDEGGAGQTRMTTHLDRIFRACDAFYAGGSTAEAFLVEVSWLEDLLAQAQRLGLGYGRLAQEGLEEFQGGLSLLRQAGERDDRALVEAGKRMLWEGSGKLQSA